MKEQNKYHFFTSKEKLLYSGLYSLFGLIALWYFLFFLNSGDTFCYLFLAENWAEGNIYEAIGGHWGMLITILLAPLLLLGIPGVLAFKILQFFIGFTALNAFVRILKTVHIGGALRLMSVLLFLPLLIHMSLTLTPDLLMVSLGLWYIYFMLQPDFLDRPIWALKAGLAAGLMFLAKSYALPFFVVHFFSSHIFYFFKKKKRSQILRTFIYGLGIFTLISSAWILLMSVKFKEITIGTSGKYNLALIGTERQNRQVTKGELINPNSRYTSFWAYQEPAHFVKKWSPFSSKENWNHYTQQLKHNLRSFYYITYIRDGILLILLLGFGWFFIRQKKEKKIPWSIPFTFLSSSFIFTLGYLIILVRPRYFWFSEVLLLLLLIWILNQFQTSLKPIFKKLIFLFTFVIISINTLTIFQPNVAQLPFFKMLHQVEKELNGFNFEQKRIAIIDIPQSAHLMEADAYLMYKKRFEFWGQPSREQLLEKGLSDLEAHGIDYFFLWENEDLKERIFKSTNPIFEHKEIGLTIYQLQ